MKNRFRQSEAARTKKSHELRDKPPSLHFDGAMVTMSGNVVAMQWSK